MSRITGPPSPYLGTLGNVLEALSLEIYYSPLQEVIP